MANSNTNSKRGFAAMDTKKQREIASKGGQASRRGSASKTTNKQTSAS